MEFPSGERCKTIARRFTDELWDQHQLSVADEIISHEFVDNDPVPGQRAGLAGYKEMISNFRSAFPDLRVRNEDVIVEANKIAIRWRARGTHQGPLMNIPPTGKEVELRGMDILRVEERKIVERWGEFDVFGMMSQLGVIAQ
jgi:steroid delta-isomerase-like uncharacterized protein